MKTLIKWLLRLVFAPRRQPAETRTMVATCSHCAQTFLAHNAPVDDFDPRAILDKDGRVICLRCRREGRAS